MALSINIAPTNDGWAVSSSALKAPLFFHSGGKAEAAGRRLGEQLARRGHAAELVIVARDGAVAGRIRFPASAQRAA